MKLPVERAREGRAQLLWLAVLLCSACSRSYQADPRRDYHSCNARVVGLSEQELAKRIQAQGSAPALDELAAKQVVTQHRVEVETCYGRTVERRGLRVGTIRAQAAIAAHGEVLRATVQHNDTGDDELVCCVVDALMTWQFPAREQPGIAAATVPFSFAPPKPESAAAAAPADLARFQQDYGSCNEVPVRRDDPTLPAGPQVTSPTGCSGCGSLSKGAVESTVQREMSAIRWCYDTSRLIRPTLQASAIVEIEIAPDGSVARSTLHSSNTGFAPLDCCITRTVAKWMFPKPEGGGRAIVRYPFELKMATP